MISLQQRCVGIASILLFGLIPVPSACAADGQLDITTTIALALDQAPLLDADDADIAAAQESLVAAGQLPDPELSLSAQNVPIEGDSAFRFSAERMTQRRVGVMQRFPNAHRRQAEREQAASQISLARARRALSRQQVREVSAAAWIERWAAERRAATLRTLQPVYSSLIAASEARVASGGATSDVLRVRLAAAHLEQRIRDAEAGIDQAVASLRLWIGPAASKPLAPAPDFGALDAEQLRRQLDRRVELAPLRAEQTVADSDIRAAEASRRPDWALALAYGDRDPAFGDLLSLEVRVDLPLFATSRQEPKIRAARERLRVVDARVEQRRRELSSALESALVRWRAALERRHHFVNQHLPLADAATDAALAGYGGGRGTLSDVLDVQGDAISQRLGLVDAEAELALAWSDLAFLIPFDGGDGVAPSAITASGATP